MTKNTIVELIVNRDDLPDEWLIQAIADYSNDNDQISLQELATAIEEDTAIAYEKDKFDINVIIKTAERVWEDGALAIDYNTGTE